MRIKRTARRNQQAEASAPDLDHLPAGATEIAEAGVNDPPEYAADERIESKGERIHPRTAGDEGDERA